MMRLGRSLEGDHVVLRVIMRRPMISYMFCLYLNYVR